MSKVKLKSSKKLNKTSLRRICNNITWRENWDLEQEKDDSCNQRCKAQWEEEGVLLQDLKCQLLSQVQSNKVEVSIGVRSQGSYQLVKQIQIKLKPEISFGKDSTIMETGTVLLLNAKRASVMWSKMKLFLMQSPQLWELSSLPRIRARGNKVISMLMTILKRENSEFSW